MPTKFIFVTGGVVSSLGKGIAASSIGLLLEKQGFTISMMKLDPYLNVDPGTMSPFQHGEVYVTDDGGETDLDLGHYFRFTNSQLSKKSSVSSGQVYNEVLRKERKGDFLGKTVQVIPHITNEIKDRITTLAKSNQGTKIIIVEIGGTVGDIESLPFLEAIRQLRYEYPQNCLNIHVTYVPYIKAAGEVKTKPTQHSVQSLRQIGLFPDMIFCRSEVPLSEEVKDKISLFCNVQKDSVIEMQDVENTIYEVPLHLHAQQVESKICSLLKIEPTKKVNLSDWEEIVKRTKSAPKVVTCGIVGKYLSCQDAYKSLFEALQHAAIANNVKLEIKKIDSEKLPSNEFPEEAKGCDGYLVPGGFGDRGWEGKIMAASYCRNNNIPYFGICLGLQVMVVEFARNVLGLQNANSTEMGETPYPVVSLLEEQRSVQDRGGTMRLGTYLCHLKEGTKAHAAYQHKDIHERHRHRYEVNNSYLPEMKKHGLIVSGTFREQDLVEIVEIKDHPWMLSVQFHPEFISKPTKAHPLFTEFVKAMSQR